MCKEK